MNVLNFARFIGTVLAVTATAYGQVDCGDTSKLPPVAEATLPNTFPATASVDGETIALGRPFDGGTGSVDVYIKSDEEWTLQQHLVASNATSGDGFGSAMDLDGNTLVVSAPYDTQSRGTVYVFERQGATWTEVAKLIAPGSNTADLLGIAVQVHGELIAAGASHSDDARTDSGVVYLFGRSGATWSYESAILPPQFVYEFGRDLAVDGTTMIVGALASAVIFESNGSRWVEQTTIASPLGGLSFGSRVAVSGDFAAVSEPEDFEGFSPAVHVYRRDGGLWTNDATLGSGCGDSPVQCNQNFCPSCSYFGAEIELVGSAIAVWASQTLTCEEICSGPGSCFWLFYGGAQVFEKTDTGWLRINQINDKGAFASGPLAMSEERLVYGTTIYNAGVEQGLDLGFIEGSYGTALASVSVDGVGEQSMPGEITVSSSSGGGQTGGGLVDGVVMAGMGAAGIDAEFSPNTGAYSIAVSGFASATLAPGYSGQALSTADFALYFAVDEPIGYCETWAGEGQPFFELAPSHVALPGVPAGTIGDEVLGIGGYLISGGPQVIQATPGSTSTSGVYTLQLGNGDADDNGNAEVCLAVPEQFASITEAINAAEDGHVIVVAPGTYFETLQTSGKAITIRSVDPLDDSIVASTIVNAQEQGSVLSIIDGERPQTIVEGLTLTGGAADSGAGVRIVGSSPTIRHCRIMANQAPLGTGNGGGLYCFNGSPLIEDCVFANNVAEYGGGLNFQSSAAVVVNCTVVANSAAVGGGTAGGSDTTPSDAVYLNTLFARNTASVVGGAVSILGHPSFINCTFADNDSNFIGGVWFIGESVGTLFNCILWSNEDSHAGTLEEAQLGVGAGAVASVDFTILEGWSGAFGGQGNLGLNPAFVDPLGADSLLASGDEDFCVRQCSPAVDSGGPVALPQSALLDLDGNDRMADGDLDGLEVLDRGAFELQPPTTPPCDLNFNGQCTAPDLAALLASWGACIGECAADLNCDGVVGVADLAGLLAGWG